MVHEFKTRRRIEFVETDMAGIVHFSNFFRFMEAAEHDFFRSLGIFLHSQDKDHLRGFARVHADCDYLRPLRLYDEFEVHLQITRIGRTSITYRFVFTLTEERGQPCEPVQIATGSLVVACVQRSPDGHGLEKASLDPRITEQLDVAPNESKEDS